MDKELLSALEVFKKAEKYGEWFSCIKALYKGNPGEIKPMVEEFRSAVIRSTYERKGDLVKESYRLLARDDFDSFMLYIEWNRPSAQKFWLPRRKKLRHVCKALQDMEDGKLDELFLSMPPRVGKSTLSLFFTLWVVLRDSERSNLYSSYSDGVCQVFYNGLLEILNDPYTYAWQDVFPDSKVATTNSKELLLNIDRPKRYASFTGRSLYGALNGACDCNGYEIIDDIHSGIEEAMNSDRLNNAWLKIENNLLPRAKMSARYLWIGTRWSMMDAIARRIDILTNDVRFKDHKWKVINVPALNEDDESNFDYELGVGFNSDYYRQRRASFERNNDMASWSAQYMGEPIERDGSVFNPDDMRYYNGTLPDCDADRIFMAVDPAWGGGDFVAGPVCYQYGDDIYVDDVVYNNGDKSVTQPLVAYKILEHKVQAVGIEATKTTREYTDGINDRLKEKGYRCNIQSTTKHFTGTGKQQRIFDKAPDIREHMIFRASGCRSKEYELFMQNVFAFKLVQNNKHFSDDGPDSLAQAINMAFFGSSKVEILKRVF